MQHRKILQTERYQAAARSKALHPTDIHVGRRVALLRSQVRMTQAQLASGVGVSVQQIQKYENAKNRISASMLYQIARCLGIPVSRLFEGLPEAAGTDTPSRNKPEHLAFLASADGQRLNDGLLALSPRTRRRLATLIETIGTELSASHSSKSRRDR